MRNLEKLKPLALLLLRCGLAIIFIYHGYPKLAHSKEWTQAFVRMGFPSYFAYIAGVVETLGGLLLVLGLATRISAVLLACEMAVALWRVDLPSGPILHVENYQLSLALAVGSFALMTFGAGILSLDYAIFRNRA